MATKIVLIRHGQTDWNKELLIQGRFDKPLNDTGKKQLEETALKLAKMGLTFDAYLCSPLQRAVESCLIIKHHIDQKNAPFIKRENLIEREFGIADGMKITDDVYKLILNDAYEGMEKSEDIQKRAKKEILDIACLYPNQCVLVVTHSHFIKALFTTLDHNLTFQSFLANGSLNFIEVENGTITSFAFNQ